MAATLLEQAGALRDALVDFEPAVLTGEDAAQVAEMLALVEKACGTARVRAAARAAQCRSHRSRGFADAADWLARLGGSTRREALQALHTARSVDPASTTGVAMATGELSLAQAGVISATEAACPGTEDQLVSLAQRSSLAKLADEGRRRRLGVVDPQELHRRHHAARELHHWRDSEGMVRLAAALPPEVGVGLVNRIERDCDRRRRATHAAEPRAAHAADALMAMLTGTGSPVGASAELVLVCDLGAYRRGHAHDGEACHIRGGGPVPVSVARRLGTDAFLKAVTLRGLRIDTVAHFGRHIPAELRTALELGAPPGFDGTECAEEGCDRRLGLEWDHRDPLAHGGTTSWANLRPMCQPHHRAKTELDRSAGLLGPGP